MDEKAGSGASPAVDADAPLVLLHGFGGSSRSWSQVTALLGDDIDVIAMDLPGHGGSLNAEGRGGAGRMARGVGGILSALNLDRYHLCGHSMGGAVAALACRRYFSFAKVLPCHYGSFGIIDQTPNAFLEAMEDDASLVATPKAGETVEVS